MSALTELAIRNAKAREKPYKLYDERGLYLIVRPNRAHWWRFRFTVGGRGKLLSLGVYPDVSLRRARAKCDEPRRQVADEMDRAVRRRAGVDLLARLAADRQIARGRRSPAIRPCLRQLARPGRTLDGARDPPPRNIVIWRGMPRMSDIAFGFQFGAQFVGN